MLVRDIIDIDSTYEDFESLNDDDDLKINKKSKPNKDKEEKGSDQDRKDENNIGRKIAAFSGVKNLLLFLLGLAINFLIKTF